MRVANSTDRHQPWAWPFVCVDCGRPSPESGFPYRCPHCGGLYDFADPVMAYASYGAIGSGEGMARFRAGFALPPGAEFVSLGEGHTPLIRGAIAGREIYFKCEYLNPTGSFKDRGTAVLVSALKAAGVKSAVEDSSGNAGASFAAYCARAGIEARLYVPEYAAGPKRSQIAGYGAEVISVPGPRSAAAEAARAAAEAGEVYASHVYLPHGLAGMATAAFELVEQMGRPPRTVLMPVGQGTLLLGVYRGFKALVLGGRIRALPHLVAVQARACAPIWAAHTLGPARAAEVKEGPTMAEGIRIPRPVRSDAILRALQDTGGMAVAVDEAEIVKGRMALGRQGFFVEPTSAVVWPALQEILEDLPDPMVAFLSGSGLKDPRPAAS